MPTLLIEDGYTFLFWSNDGHEPPHVHVRGRGGAAKLWLLPGVHMARSRGYNDQRRGEIIRKTEAHRDEWIAAWRRHFGS